MSFACYELLDPQASSISLGRVSVAKESRLASGRTFCDGWKVSMRMRVGRTGWVGEGCGRARAEWSAGHAWLAAEWRAGVVGLSWRGREGLELGGCSALSKQD